MTGSAGSPTPAEILARIRKQFPGDIVYTEATNDSMLRALLDEEGSEALVEAILDAGGTAWGVRWQEQFHRGRHPEAACDDCGGRNIKPWWTSSDRWRLAVSTYGGSPAHPDHDAILCPACFVDRWEQATGLMATWRLEPDPSTIRAQGSDDWFATRNSIPVEQIRAPHEPPFVGGGE